MKDSPMVIGLTGAPRSGKGETKEIILALAKACGIAARHVSFSGMLLKEARRILHRPSDTIDRDEITSVVTRLREQRGNDVIAALVVERITSDANPVELYVAEALRHPAEAEHLRAAFGDRFRLVAVTAPTEELVRRMLSSPRSDESRFALLSPDAARRVIEREMHGDGSAHSINVSATVERADYVIANDLSLADLREKIEALLPRVVAELRAGG